MLCEIKILFKKQDQQPSALKYRTDFFKILWFLYSSSEKYIMEIWVKLVNKEEVQTVLVS